MSSTNPVTASGPIRSNSSRSMDYEVFLVSRMREVWVHRNDNHRAVTGGLAGTARVITAAA